MDERIKRCDRYAFERRYGIRIRPELAKAARLLFCGMIVVLFACAASHPTYTGENLPQVMAYLDSHCPPDSRGIAHYDALSMAYDQLNRPDFMLVAERERDKRLVTCREQVADPWTQDAAALMFATNSMREAYKCPEPSGGSKIELHRAFLCKYAEEETRHRELLQLSKATASADIRSYAQGQLKYVVKEMRETDCSISQLRPHPATCVPLWPK